MEKKRPQTARQYVLGMLRAEILRGEHCAGARLRQEEVASRLGVSTTPVREAFRDLLAEGLIGLDTHRGVLVRGLTLADVRELYELRIVLEPMLAVRALSLTDTTQLDAAEAIHLRLCGEKDPERWASLNVAFHQALNVAAADGRMSRIVAGLAEAAGSYVSLSMHATPELMALNNGDHAELLRLYRLRDEDGVAAKTAAHLAQTLSAIERDVETRVVVLAEAG
ncbi:GntR family transcriptional regulator [Acidisoma cellulosilytica]|uniref:GntR family transcriptional regulator n=1 Tax=Acidisoma cellulosilyticum TaxID=2802395 RepID=A0A964E5K7_9PROT|nr:GntR family transcriptional regulator [Acidisoma cellulosilyticum]MCB8882629.1 GntR family transcriptional regulator [Acidisoma cellulosilyticum]